MQRRLLLTGLLLASGCNGGGDRLKCPAGEVAVGGQCRVLCRYSTECRSDEACGADGYCIVRENQDTCTLPGDCDPGETCDPTGYCIALEELPRIDRVLGDGADGRVGAALVVEGARLSNVLPQLTRPGGRIEELTICAGSHSARLLLDLPDDVVPGEYTLSLTNQAGTCGVTVPLLQGSDDTPAQVFTKLNQALADDPSRTLKGTLAGDLLTTLVVTAEGGGVSRSIRANGAEQVGPPSLTYLNDGIFVSLIDRATHTVVTSWAGGAIPVNANYGTGGTDVASLTALLNSLDGSVMVMLASRGSVAPHAADAALRTQIQSVGGTVAFDTLTATQRYVLIGIKGLAAGRGVEMIAEGAAPAAVTALMIDAAALGFEGSVSP